jgi:hypothetical protein
MKNKGANKMTEMQTALTAIKNMPQNNVIQYPTGRWGFVGQVDSRLAYCCKDGSEATADQIQKAIQHGPGIVGLKSKTWETKELALEAAACLSLKELL